MSIRKCGHRYSNMIQNSQKVERTQIPSISKWMFTGVGQSTWILRKKILRYASTDDLHNQHARRKKTVTEAHISIVLFYLCSQYVSLQRQKAQQWLPRAGRTEGRMEGFLQGIMKYIMLTFWCCLHNSANILNILSWRTLCYMNSISIKLY